MARLADLRLPAALAATLLLSSTGSALAASKTPTPRPETSPAVAAASPSPTRVPPTATPSVTSTPTATATATAAATATATATPTATATANAAPPSNPQPSPTTRVLAPSIAGDNTIHGAAFVDANANGQLDDGEQVLMNVEVTLAFGNGLTRTTRSDDTGAFAFDGLAPGAYHVALTVPTDYVPTTDAGQDVDVVEATDPGAIQFGLITNEAAGLAPDANGPDANSDDDQIIALASVTSLPLRFAEGRDLMNQLQRKVLGDGLIWLGVPFRSQMDGGDFQYVNCGPASLTMVLAGFGLEVGPSQVRDYLNVMIDNFNRDQGTSLDVLSQIGRQAGLTPMDLYSDQGGYRDWSTDAVRWHVQQGHPVITLVKYRDLPGHTSSLSQFDHYIVITGLTPNGFIYNDGAFATTLGYGLEISDVELEYAWDNSSIPHHALALGLNPDQKALSFPEVPRQPRTVAPDVVSGARSARRQAEADSAALGRAPLLLTPTVAVSPPPVAATSAASPLVSDRWQDDPSFANIDPPVEPGTPMGLNMTPTEQPAIEAKPGPGAQVPKLLALLGVAWALLAVWALAAPAARRLPSFATLRRATYGTIRTLCTRRPFTSTTRK